MLAWPELGAICTLFAPLLWLYVRLLRAIRTGTAFQSAFYRTVFLGGVVDILNALLVLVCAYLINTDWFINNLFPAYFSAATYALSPLLWLRYFLMFASCSTPLLMASNRLTGLLTTKYEMIWKNATLVFVVFYILVPVSCTFHVLAKPAVIEPFGDADQIVLNFHYVHTVQFGPRMGPTLLVYTLLFSLTTLALNMCNMGCLLSAKFGSARQWQRERTMVVCAVCVFLNEVAVFVAQYFYEDNTFDKVFTVRYLEPFLRMVHFLMPGLIVAGTVAQLRATVFGGRQKPHDALFTSREWHTRT